MSTDAGATASLAVDAVIPRGSIAPITVWLCRPGLADDPCTSSLTATAVTASGSTSIVKASVAPNPRFDCFYVYPTVSRELMTNADLRVQKTEIAAAVTQASRFSQVRRVYAPIFGQVSLPDSRSIRASMCPPPPTRPPTTACSPASRSTSGDTTTVAQSCSSDTPRARPSSSPCFNTGSITRRRYATDSYSRSFRWRSRGSDRCARRRQFFAHSAVFPIRGGRIRPRLLKLSG
jgi:hypothetical protein